MKKEKNQLKIEGYKIREEELLDYNEEEIENDTIVWQKLRKKKIARIIKQQDRNH